MSEALTIAFAGTPAFAVPALEALLSSAHRVAVVYTQPDRPAGRGRQLHASPVKQCALEHAVVVEQPVSLRAVEAVDTLAGYRPDLLVVVAYGMILPRAILEVPRLGCLNIHASLLPRWRGAAPIQRAVLAGDARTGVSIMRMEEGLDTGPVLLEWMTEIGSTETAGTVHDRLATAGAALLLEAIDGYVAGTLQPLPQAAEGVTYARKILKAEAMIEWKEPAVAIDRCVRAFNPVPVAETRWRGQQLRILEAEPLDIAVAAAPGMVVAANRDGIDVATGNAVLRVRRLQLEGRKPTSAAEFVNAHTLVGERFGAPATHPDGAQ